MTLVLVSLLSRTFLSVAASFHTFYFILGVYVNCVTCLKIKHRLDSFKHAMLYAFESSGIAQQQRVTFFTLCKQ
jgi:hypothetical protein